MNSAVRSGFDAFRLSIRECGGCNPANGDAVSGHRRGPAARRSQPSWRCSNFKFEIAEVGFDLFDPQRAARLSAIPTRLKLPTEDVDFLISRAARQF